MSNILTTKSKINNNNNNTKDKRRRRRTPASKAVYNTAYTVVSFESRGPQTVKFYKANWYGILNWPCADIDNKQIGPYESVLDLVKGVSSIVRTFMRIKQNEYTELIFKMPNGGPKKMFIYLEDIDNDKIIDDTRDGDMNAYE